MTQRTIVVGDIHGCYDELCDLLERIAFGPDDRLIAVGDLVVKGPKNKEVLDAFIGNQNYSAVLGNHDRALLRYWRDESESLKKSQEECRAELEDDRARYAAYLSSLPLMIDLGAHLVVHAGIRPGIALKKQIIEDQTELRTLGADRTSREGQPWYEAYRGEKFVLFGHWPASAPRRASHALGLDTGCVYGHLLTAYIIESDELMSVPARRTYDPPRHRLR